MANTKDKNKDTLRSFINYKKAEQAAPAETMQPGDVMLDTRYIKSSSQLISDALQKGFDVLQMSNGDVVTTGTKTVVYKYSWDEATGKLKRTSVTTKDSKSTDELEPEERIVGEALLAE